MVELPGSLERSTLGDVLGVLYRDRVSGALRLEELHVGREQYQHVIYLHEGLIHHVETTLTPSAGTPAAAAGRARVEGWTPESARQDAASKWERLRRLEALFELRQVRLTFRVMGRHRARAPQPLGPTEFLHGRRRQRDADEPAAPPPVRVETAREQALRTLGLDGEPTADTVRTAFRQLARRWHPDRHPHAGEHTRAALCRRFAQISTAYQQLIAQSA